MSVFQQLYDSGINFSVSCSRDGGFQVKLGDALNDYASETVVESWDEGEPWLRAQAQLHHPESQFAKATLAPI